MLAPQSHKFNSGWLRYTCCLLRAPTGSRLEYSTVQLRRGLVLAITANCLWGISALYWLETQPSAPIDVLAHRALWSLPVATLVLLWARRFRETMALIRRPSTLAWSALAALLLSGNWGVFLYAVTTGRATEASLGYFMLPLLTILVGSLFFAERLGSIQRIALVMAVAAVVIQVLAYGSLPWVSLVVAGSFALYGAIRKKIVADTIQGLFLETLCMAPLALVWFFLEEGAGLGRFGARVDLFLLLSGVFTAAPLLTYIAATRLLPLSVVGLTSYIGPTLQLLVAQTVLGEPIDTPTMMSFALVWAGVVLVSGQGLRRVIQRRLEGMR